MRSKHSKHIVDILLGIGLLLLMSYQVTSEAGHEWTGIVMTVLMILHQILNQKWYAALFKGKYTPLRTVQTLVNAALVICFVLTALCGINMSVHAVPFLSEFMRASLGRRLHLTLSHWCFVLMGLHLGLHIPAMLKGVKGLNVRRIGFGCSILAAGAGLWLFLKNSYPDYLFYRVPFAFIDYDKAAWLVLLEALLIAFFWVFVGAQLPKLLNRRADTNRKLISLIGILLAVVIGMGLTFAFPAGNEDSWNEKATPWGTVVNEENAADETPVPVESTAAPAAESEETPVDDGFVWIEGGTFLMGSPETENWRIDDETQHEVTISGFWMSPYEVTQAEYERLMGVDPSSFKGDNLPIESVTWLDAVRFCNAMSAEAGLTAAYVIDGETVTWNRGANDYRLPTEAEWEYACRAGTTTPFNTIHATGPEEANYYGHYPYEIEENYFDDSVLETRPGRYRQTTVPMPIATFLESYDFSGKTILPFCSHGGGRFGQSLTAIAKLAPQAVIAPGLSVHCSGGTSLPNDVRAWLESQGIPATKAFMKKPCQL